MGGPWLSSVLAPTQILLVTDCSHLLPFWAQWCYTWKLETGCGWRMWASFLANATKQGSPLVRVGCKHLPGPHALDWSWNIECDAHLKVSEWATKVRLLCKSKVFFHKHIQHKLGTKFVLIGTESHGRVLKWEMMWGGFILIRSLVESRLLGCKNGSREMA
jgi:hypothetical protein